MLSNYLAIKEKKSQKMLGSFPSILSLNVKNILEVEEKKHRDFLRVFERKN